MSYKKMKTKHLVAALGVLAVVGASTSVLSQLGSLPPGSRPSAAAGGPTVSNVVYGPPDQEYGVVTVTFNMENNVTLPDGTVADYKVPLKLQVPQYKKQCNGLALADLVNTSSVRGMYTQGLPVGGLVFDPALTNVDLWMAPTGKLPHYNIDMEYKGADPYLRENLFRYTSGARRFPVDLPAAQCAYVAAQAKALVAGYGAIPGFYEDGYLEKMDQFNGCYPAGAKCTVTQMPCGPGVNDVVYGGDCGAVEGVPYPNLCAPVGACRVSRNACLFGVPGSCGADDECLNNQGRCNLSGDACDSIGQPCARQYYVGPLPNGQCLLPTSMILGNLKLRNTGGYELDESMLDSVMGDTIMVSGTKGLGDAFGKYYLEDDFLFSGQNGGYAYAQVYWDETTFDTLKRLGHTDLDATLHSSVKVTPFIWRDVSKILRDLPAYLGTTDTDGKAAFARCRVRDVFGFGFSQTGYMLNTFLMDRWNTGLAAGEPAFDDGLVFEGVLKGGDYGLCKSLTEADSPYLFPKEYPCPTDGGKLMEKFAGQGKVIALANDDEVLHWSPDIQAQRGQADGENGVYYREYELVAQPHVTTPGTSTPWADEYPQIKAFGDTASFWYPVAIGNPPRAIQSSGPVYRAALKHLVDWVSEDGTAPPPSAPYETDSSGQIVFGEDGFPKGGVRLPNVRTVSGDKEFGAPLGWTTTDLTDWFPCALRVAMGRPADLCKPEMQPPFYLNNQGALGAYYPYASKISVPGLPTPVTIEKNIGAQKAFDQYGLAAKCAEYYPDFEAYKSALNAAVDHAIRQGWVLKSDRDALINNAVEILDMSPGCVPLPADWADLTLAEKVKKLR